jgi:hypothetical protein
LAELEYEEQTRHASQTLEKLFVTGERDYVIGHGEKQVSLLEIHALNHLKNNSNNML